MTNTDQRLKTNVLYSGLGLHSEITTQSRETVPGVVSSMIESTKPIIEKGTKERVSKRNRRGIVGQESSEGNETERLL